MWIVTVAPEARVAKVQFSTWEPTAPLMAQFELSGFSDQLRVPVVAPSLAGNESVTMTLVASAAPVFDTVMSKPMVSPALTGPAGTAVLTMPTFGAFRTFHSSKPPSLPQVLPSGEAPAVVPHRL